MIKYILNWILLVITKPIHSSYLIKNMILNKFIKKTCKEYNLWLIYHHKNVFDIVMSWKWTIVEQELMRWNFENYLENFYSNNLKSDSVFFDIWTNIWFFSLLWWKKISTWKIYSFDADKNMVDLLNKSILINKFNNIEVYNNAIWEINTVMKFNIQEDPAFNSLWKVSNQKLAKTVDVECITLDDFIKNKDIPKIDFIKIDIEWAELLALKWMIHLLNKYKPVLSLEVADNTFSYFDYTSKDLLDFMKSIWYKIYNYRNNKLEIEEIKNKYIYDNLIFIPSDYNISEIK